MPLSDFGSETSSNYSGLSGQQSNALFSGVGGYVGSQIQNGAINNAGSAITRGYNEGRDALNQGYQDATGRYKQARTDLTDQYGVARGDINPYVQDGGKARSRMMDATGLNGQQAQSAYANSVYENPLFKKQLDLAGGQMSQAYDARNANAGNMYSGAAMMAKNRGLGELSTNMASQFEDNQYKRMAGINQQGFQGSMANASLAQSHGTNLAGNEHWQGGNDMSHGSDIANLGLGYANAQAQMAAAQGRNSSSGIGSLFGAVGSLFGGPAGGAAGSALSSLFS
jgi:hypothetical protein